MSNWEGARLYISTWEFTGEGSYVIMQPEPSMWYFGGAEADAPKIMDDVLVTLPRQ